MMILGSHIFMRYSAISPSRKFAHDNLIYSAK